MRIGLFVYPRFQLLDVAGPVSVFEMAGRLLKSPVSTRLLAVEPGAVQSSAGVEVTAFGIEAADDIDILIVAGGLGVDAAAASPRALDFIRSCASRGRRVASVCSGAFLLASAGLLDGRRATTHWGRTEDFLRRFPRVRLEPDRIFVKDGSIWTSAGISAGIDLALAMAAEDFGETIARQVARQLVVFYQRPGGQSQFSSLVELKAPTGRFKPLLAWARDHLDERLTVERLADEAHMSARHFARAFNAETGLTPSKAIERLRLDVARERVESAPEPIEGIARSTGFGDPDRMRRAFIRAFGQPPQSLRRAARKI